MNEKLAAIKRIREELDEEFNRACSTASACFDAQAASLAVAAEGSQRTECDEAIRLLKSSVNALGEAVDACAQACTAIDDYLAAT